MCNISKDRTDFAGAYFFCISTVLLQINVGIQEGNLRSQQAEINNAFFLFTFKAAICKNSVWCTLAPTKGL